MKNLKVLLLLCFVTLSGTGCRELPLGPLEGDCSDLPPSDSPIGYHYETESPFRYGPQFNPKSGQQFTFVEYYPEQSKGDLFIYNKETEDRTLIIPNVITPGYWSSTGWIMATGSDGRIRKIKDNGDSLTVIDNGYEEFPGSWNPDGSKMIVRRLAPTEDVLLVLDKNGVILDSIPRGAFKPLCWLQPDKIYGGVFLNENQGSGFSTRTIGYYDLNTEQLVPIYEIGDYNDNKTGRIYMTGDPEQEILYWTNLSGFYRTEIESGQTYLLLQNCETRSRAYLTVSPDGKQIVTGLSINKKVGENTIRSTGMLVEYDVNGIEQQVFDF